MNQPDYLKYIQKLKTQTLVFLVLMLAGFISAGIFYYLLQKSKNDLAASLTEKQKLYDDMVSARAMADSISELYKAILIKSAPLIARSDTILARTIDKTVEKNKYANYLVYLQQGSKTDMPFSKDLLQNLRQQGFQAPGIQTVSKPISNGVYYFHDEDKQVAEALLQILKNVYSKSAYSTGATFKLYNRNYIKAPEKQLEIWVSLENNSVQKTD